MKSKVLLMGKCGSGKTSMRSIIFANHHARETFRLGPTNEIEHSHVRFLGDLVLNLWDCGGQDQFMENYFRSQRDHIFRNVEVLIYVFDVDTRNKAEDLGYFQSCLDAIEEHSAKAKIFCLIHKMDLLPNDNERTRVFEERQDELQAMTKLKLTCFKTSIWDETLYGAWSSVVFSLVPNVERLEKNLQQFCDLCRADEIVLFERATFLVISHITKKEHYDKHRFEKISNIVKQFKLSCGKSGSQFMTIEVSNAHYKAFIDGFTANTNIMVIMGDPNVESAATRMNIQTAKKHFENLILANSD